ncbi:MAG TPA: serine peptidase [Gammaproteobacteria bacterium]|nr:serine peptidase [Gammaproteobacteria bacterium]
MNLALTPSLLFIVLSWCVSVTNVAWALVPSGLPDFTPLVKQNSASVVNISTTQKVTSQIQGLPPGMNIPDIPEDSPLREFFEHFFSEGGPREYDSRSLGSGFFISDDGYIITNHHVIDGADEILVRLSDRREMIAEVIGSDPRSDIALIKIDATALPTVRIGKVKELQVGEWVLAIGSPFGFDYSVTAGIVSAKGRALPRENYVPFIQTDVAINPGNSGGPLFNMEGEVVGVNSQIYSRTGGFMGLSFAVPIDVAMDVVNQLKDKGRVSRGWLGVLIQDVTSELAQSFGLKKPEGALVAKVLPDSPSEQGGIKVGDIILEFNGAPIDKSSDLPPLVGRTPVETKVPVKVLRDGKMKTLTITLGELPEETLATGPDGDSKSDGQFDKLGLSVKEVSSAVREKMALGKGGVYVELAGPGPARDAGVGRGDVLTMLNGKQIKGLKHYGELLETLPEKGIVPVLIHKPNGPVFQAIKIE